MPCPVGKFAADVWLGDFLDADSTLSLDRLAPAARLLLGRAAAIAAARGAAPYLVGGGVRDLLLGRTTIDLDLVVVGDAIGVARALHDALGGDGAATLRVHEAFGTATMIPQGGPPLDLITARRETYPVPGALPIVTPGSLDDDLRRRDFTINAIALSLDPDTPGRLYDPLGGRADLDAGIVRTLHAASFRDDPTRLLRATRYVVRLGFAFDRATAAQFAAAIAARAFDTITTQRLSHEFVRLLAEERTAAMLDRLAVSGALAQLAPTLCWGDAERAAFGRLDGVRGSLLADPGSSAVAAAIESFWELRFAVLTAALTPDAARDAATALALPGRVAALAGQAAALVASLAAAPLPQTNSALGQRLDRYEVAAIVTALAYSGSDEDRAALRRYLLAVREVRPQLDGLALRALGVPPGPIYREALAGLRDYKRDHPAATEADERDFLRAWLAGRD